MREVNWIRNALDGLRLSESAGIQALYIEWNKPTKDNRHENNRTTFRVNVFFSIFGWI